MSQAYLAGAMRGHDDFNFARFFQAEAYLSVRAVARRLGVKGRLGVFNPARADCLRARLPYGSTEEARQSGEYLVQHPENAAGDIRVALAEDMAFITERADLIVVIRGWETSSGVRAELAVARAIGLPVWELDLDVALSSGEHENPTLRPLDLDEAVRAPYEPQEVFPGGPTAYSFVEAQETAQEAIRPTIFGKVDASIDRAQTESSKEVASDGEVRTTSSTGGEKGVKLARFDLLPVGPLTALAEHYGRGARKYADHQWRKGYEWSKSYAAMMRHATQWWSGEDIDEETGSNHLAAVAWHAFNLLEATEHWPQHDDRFRYPEPEPEPYDDEEDIF